MSNGQCFNQGNTFLKVCHNNMSSCDYREESRNCQTLLGRMGTGGGNVPLVICIEKAISFRGPI